jgi:hypothetical protein
MRYLGLSEILYLHRRIVDLMRLSSELGIKPPFAGEL